MNCGACPSVPVVSEALAVYIAKHIEMDIALRREVLDASLEWLTTRHAGLSSYQAITGRGYTDEERDQIGPETAVVAGLECPLKSVAGCRLAIVGMTYDARRDAGYKQYGWLPTLLARQLASTEYKDLARNGLIADAKIALLTRRDNFPTREDAVG
ncbi:MAG: hypothetical protein C4542_09575 [Dehalococcoidia bacterium]|nr:MAG: hypothetical protein C4542_09575 [Dehalococcoidia bacterium]